MLFFPLITIKVPRKLSPDGSRQLKLGKIGSERQKWQRGVIYCREVSKQLCLE